MHKMINLSFARKLRLFLPAALLAALTGVGLEARVRRQPTTT